MPDAEQPNSQAEIPAAGPVPNPPRRQNSKYDVLVALRRCRGDRAKAAEILGVTIHAVKARIENDRQLKQLYGDEARRDFPSAPVSSEVIERTADDLPAGKDEKESVAAGLQLISLVSPEDTHRLIEGLRKFDFSDDSLDAVRALGNLATDTGRFIAVALEKTHQNYVVQQFGLMELAARVRKRLLVPQGEQGYVDNEETRAFLHKNYVEMVRESGRGVERGIQLAGIITRMLEAASSKEKNKATKKGWKKVTASDAHGQA